MPGAELILSAIRRFYIDDQYALSKLGANMFNWQYA